MKQKLYLDTSVLSGFYDQEQDILYAYRAESLRRIFQHASVYEICVSPITLLEIDRMPNQLRRDHLLELAFGCYLIGPEKLTDEILELAEAYRKGSLGQQMNDSLHLAYATLAGIYALLTWDEKHLVKKEKMINQLNRERNLPLLKIYLPNRFHF